MNETATSTLPARLAWFLERVQANLLSEAALRNYAFLAIILTVVIVLEMARRRNWRMRYGSRSFRIDVLYFVFYYGGIYHLIFYMWLYRLLTGVVAEYAPWLQVNLLGGLPDAARIVVFILVFDFIGYWSHRWRHANRFLWSFHTVHHSQAVLTPMANYRFHFLDETFLRLCLFVPFQILGTDVVLWLWLDFIFTWVLLVQHSDLDWTYGPLGRVFVSPAFHRLHHSTNPAQHDRNYAMLFAFWDDLFGSADRTSAPPTTYGLPDNAVPETLYGHLVAPFAIFARSLRTPASLTERAKTPAP